MWNSVPECRGDSRCPLSSARDFHLCYLIFDYHPGGELPCTNPRAMTVNTAVSVLRWEAMCAAQAGKTDMRIVMVCGEPFRRFTELRTLCEWAWEECPSGVRMEFELTSSFDIEHFGEILGGWYIDNRNKIRLWLRCKSLTIEMLEFAQNTGCGIEVALDYEQPRETADILGLLLKKEIPVRFALLPPEGVPDGAIAPMFDMLQSIPCQERLPGFSEMVRLMEADDGVVHDAVSGRTYDTSGYCWPCPALSPMRLHSRDIQEFPGTELESTGCTLNWSCPGERLRTGNAWGQHRKIYFYLLNSGMKCVRQLNNPELNALMNKMMNDRRVENEKREGRLKHERKI